ncbi:MAG: hypothetical protein HPY90_07680 [Syntrophothermus sp.]|uniref:hypothetical protein n=1 Tax=Syntrophothermus sp. TaxID=2736299 RepID=UPI00257F26A5|nr:hypothetical protein [Syntrophothermus sp.]NSW83141.1 hypothetical protein [Syntrophothermus sp.]
MALHKRTLDLIDAARDVLAEYHPMTLRQVYYQLVSRHVIENTRSEYQRLSNALVKARQEGWIPWEWVEDRTRRPRDVSMWSGLDDFIDTVRRAYRRDVWETQERYVVVWLEKDALSGVFEEITLEYGVTLLVGRGYNSWSIRKELAERFISLGKPAVVLYFGDFDPSGEDICRDLRESFSFFGIYPRVEKVALTREDVIRYKLPPDFAKKTDSRAKKFIERYGDMAVELDALPMPALQDKIRKSIEAHMDLEALGAVFTIEREEREQLKMLLA